MTLFFKPYTSPTSTSSSWKKTFISILIASFVLSHSSCYVSAQDLNYPNGDKVLSNALFMTTRVSGGDPNVSEKQTNVYPRSSQACLDEIEDLIDDDDLNDALDEVQAQAQARETCNDEETSCSLYFSESELRTVEDACDAANGSFYSNGAILECDGVTEYYTNFPWCAGNSCTFDEYFDSIADSLDQIGCTLDQDESSENPTNSPSTSSDSEANNNTPSSSSTVTGRLFVISFMILCAWI